MQKLNTRNKILNTAFELIYKKGFNATSIDDIIKHTSYTKGAFFHHFKTKEDLGIALISDIIKPGMEKVLIIPLITTKDPISSIYSGIENLLLNAELFDIKYGCPAINLIEEMSPVNKRFYMHLSQIIISWENAIEQSIEKAKQYKLIRSDIVPKEVSCFVISGYAGIRNLGKLKGYECYNTYLEGLDKYLKSLIIN
ncbi:transcriptional regulator, TetR family [Arenibacter nanhaiticus]|uniref:Transcriptional regulator, TetR family n=1 Tax=Arenibacter nanhaiticus TaxID=558155 RepID=A0A1M6C5T2_9FLAO|nr:TetR/AcrR family transcriptional regulator [Arenibacter nanhaiticus]SHI56385.1 transcriptional regulator, TetR family [Arenibacter nanhaiticus]